MADKPQDESKDRKEAWANLGFEERVCPLCPVAPGAQPVLKLIAKGLRYCSSCRHTLTANDLQRMNVPEQFWKATVPEATESVRPVIQNFIENFKLLFAQGAGIYLSGAPGVGKTSAAVVLLKAARARFKSGYFARVAELRDAIRLQHDFDADQTVLSRAREVDMLVVDAFSEVDFKLPYFKLEDLMDLVAQRGQRQRVTVVTTTLAESDVRDASPQFFETVGAYLMPFKIKETENRRTAKKVELAKLVFTEPKTKGRK